MNTVLRHDEEKTSATIHDLIGAPVAAITGIFLLFYPYVIVLAFWEDPSRLIGPQVVKVSFCILFAFIFFVPRATQTFFRSRQSWLGAFFVRFILFVIFAWICFKFFESAKYYPGPLRSLVVEGYEPAYLTFLTVWGVSYLTSFVIPGRYIRLLRHRHERKLGAKNGAYEPKARHTVAGTIFKALVDNQSPGWSRAIGGISIILSVAVILAANFTVSYPSSIALDLYKEYWILISGYLLATLLLLVSVTKTASGGARLKLPESYSLLTIPGIIFLAWLVPIAFFQSVLPNYFRYFGNTQQVVKEFIVIDIPGVESRKCKRGLHIIDPQMDEPFRQRVCKVPVKIFNELSTGSSIFITAIKTDMGYALGEFVREDK